MKGRGVLGERAEATNCLVNSPVYNILIRGSNYSIVNINLFLIYLILFSLIYVDTRREYKSYFIRMP